MRIKKINKIKPWLIQIQLKAFLFGPMFFFFLFFPEPRLKTWKRKRRRRPIIGNKVHMGFFFFFLNVLAVFAGGRRRRGRRSLCLLFFIEDKHSCWRYPFFYFTLLYFLFILEVFFRGDRACAVRDARVGPVRCNCFWSRFVIEFFFKIIIKYALSSGGNTKK